MEWHEIKRKKIFHRIYYLRVKRNWWLYTKGFLYSLKSMSKLWFIRTLNWFKSIWCLLIIDCKSGLGNKNTDLVYGTTDQLHLEQQLVLSGVENLSLCRPRVEVSAGGDEWVVFSWASLQVQKTHLEELCPKRAPEQWFSIFHPRT